jgi:alkylhydroperoxidase family enzyme
MAYLPTNGLPIIEEEEATGEVAEIYDELKRGLQIPFVPNLVKPMASSPEMLAFFTKYSIASQEYHTLPQLLVSMINHTISTTSNCLYCSASCELSCRTLGIDPDTLEKLTQDLPNLTPERIQAIIDFALRVARHPQELVREQGVTDGEIVEIIITAASSVMSDIIADALQVHVDDRIAVALDQMK